MGTNSINPLVNLYAVDIVVISYDVYLTTIVLLINN